ALVENDGETGPLMDPDLEQQPIAGASIIEIAHRLAHAERGGNRPVGGGECRHHRVAAGLDHGARLRRDDLVEELEMGSDEVERDQITDPFIKFRRAPEIWSRST